MRIMIALASLLAASAAAAQGNVDGNKYDKGAVVTIQGCVVAAQGKDSYVLTGVKEWPVGTSPMGIFGPRHYWVNNPGMFENRVGQTVQLKGTIAKVEESEVEREPGGWHGGARVAIELPGADVITAPFNAGVGMAKRTSKEDVKITLLQLEVQEVIVVLKTCLGVKPPGFD